MLLEKLSYDYCIIEETVPKTSWIVEQGSLVSV
jgi:hypothetical protein